jgi:hypothetical protein
MLKEAQTDIIEKLSVFYSHTADLNFIPHEVSWFAVIIAVEVLFSQ